jgi:hypothetical protein
VNPLRLDARDDEVWQLTLRAAESSRGIRATLVVRCRLCGSTLAQASPTPLGPLFTSSWTVDRDPGFRVYVNGRTLSRGQALRHDDAWMPVVESSGPPITHEERHGVLALLALPTQLPADYPDLLVRCLQHGDAVLDRRGVLECLRRKERQLKVDPARPLHQYEPLRRDGGESVTSSETRRYRGTLRRTDGG